MITIDLESGVPIEEQIRSRIRELIALGKLAEGRALPSVRQLAADLAVHFTTVGRAYRRLQEDGVLVVGQGRGVFVRSVDSRPTPTAGAARGALRERLRELFADARLSGLTTVQTRDFVLGELERFDRQEKRP